MKRRREWYPEPVAVLTVGALALRRKLLGGMSQQEIAARIGATRSAVAHWASGRKKPALYLHVTGLERELGIEYRDWHRLPQECDGAIISGATFKPRATQGTPSAANK